MTDRNATVEIASLGGGEIVFRLIESHVAYSNMLDYSRLGVNVNTMPPLDSRANVEAYGTRLKEALQSHSAVGSELAQIFGTAFPHRANLKFALTSPDGEMFRWETLCNDPTSFLAINHECSVRRTGLAWGASDTGLRTFLDTIRMSAFLSPIGVESKKEFDALSAAVTDARVRGLPIEATFYLGEHGLLEWAATEISAGRLAGVTVEPMPGDTSALEKVLTERPVHLLHVFCHGRVNAGIQMLEFASINDQDIAAQSGSIQLSIERLSGILATTNSVWLTVLGSCSGAEAPPRLHSMASALTKAGSPMTIGMAEPILHHDATLFTDRFYRSALKIIEKAVTVLPQGASAVIDLGPAMDDGRKALHACYIGGPENAFGRWALPILYQRSGPLKIARIDSSIKERVETVARYLRGLPGDTPYELRGQILALLDKEPPIPKEFRPDHYGTLA